MEGKCRGISLWGPILGRSCSYNSSNEMLRGNPPQDISLPQAWGLPTQIRIFRRVFCLSQLRLNFKMLNSAYWGRQNSHFVP